MGYYLGIDLGTTYTAAATEREGVVESLTLGNRASSVPSVVFLREDGAILIGEAATRRALSEPGRVAREFKRRVGDPTPIILGGTPYAAEMLMARLLRWSADRVCEHHGEPPRGIALTHPANWGAFKLDLFAQAIRQVDLDAAVMLPEPVAAAAFYASQRPVPIGSMIAVYDLGGGTFDAAMVRRDACAFEIIGTPEGIDRLGGIDFDEAVFAHVRNTVGDHIDRLDPDEPAAHAAVARLRQECIDAKEALSSDTDVSIPVLLPRLQTEVRLTRTEFEAMIRPAIAETIVALRRAIRSAGLGADDIGVVLLVGGSSRIPLVAQMISAELGRPIAIDAHPKEAIALGAAITAAQHRGAATPESVTTLLTDTRPPSPTVAPDPPQPHTPQPDRPPRRRPPTTRTPSHPPGAPTRRRPPAPRTTSPTRTTPHHRRLSPLAMTLGGGLTVLLLVIATLSTRAALNATHDARHIHDQTELAQATIGPNGLITALQNERNLGSAYVLGFESALELPVASYEDATAETDQAIETFRSEIASDGGAVGDPYSPALREVSEQIGALREIVTGYEGPRNQEMTDVSDPFFMGVTELIDELFRANAQVPLSIDDPTLRRGVELTDLATHQIENVARLTRVVLLAGVGGGLDQPDEIAETAGLVGQVEANLDQTRDLGIGRYRPATETAIDEFTSSGYLDYVQQAVDTGEVQLTEMMGSLSREDDEGFNGLRTAVHKEITAHAIDVAEAADTRQRRLTFIAIIAVVLAVVSVLTVTTYIVSRRRRLPPDLDAGPAGLNDSQFARAR